MGIQVNKELLPMKAHYFLFYAGYSPTGAFMPVIAKQLGFSSAVVGTIYTVVPIMCMLAKLLFGYIADRYRRHRQVFITFEVLTGIAYFAIMFVPAIPQSPPSVQFHCYDNVSELRFCSTLDNCIEHNLGEHFGTEPVNCKLHCKAEPFIWDIVCQDWLTQNNTQCNSSMDKRTSYLDISISLNMSNVTKLDQCLQLNILDDQGEINGERVLLHCPKEKQYMNTSCEIDCNDQYLANELADSEVITNSDAIGLYQFWLFFLLIMIGGMSASVVVSVGDAICFAILGDRPHLYGKQSWYGSAGYGIISIISGVLVDELSKGSPTKSFAIIYWMTIVFIAFDVIVSLYIKHTQTHFSPNILKDVGKMFLSIRCIIFFVWCILVGIYMSMIWYFLFWHLEDLDAQIEGCNSSMKTLQGIALGIQCLAGEVPFFFLSGWILKRIGHVNAMSLVLFGFGVRFILYSILTDPWYVLPIELLNGVSYGIFYATMTSFASIIAPLGTEATMQSLVGSIYEGIGVSIGSFLGGLLFNSVGGAKTFEIFAIVAFVACFVHICLQLCLQRKQVKKS